MMDSPGPAPAKTDEALWQQLKEGSEQALGKLINRYFNVLQNYGCKFVRDEAFVKDCVQEVFIELWRRRERLSIPNRVRAYLLGSVRKRVLREGYRQKLIGSEEPEHQDLENNGQLVEFSPEWQTIEQESLTETTQRLSTALAKIPKRQREAIYLRYYQNLERDEIAEIMDVNPQSVSNLLQAAYVSLRDKFPLLLLLAKSWQLISFSDKWR